MTNVMAENRRILVIDDNVSIHEDFRKILAPPHVADSLDQARAALFGEPPTLPPQVRYELEFADQGREGFGLAQSARAQGNPYAVAFVDMRMPPGWDGLETIEHIWYVDPEIQIVICTAFSDHPWEDVSRRIGGNDRLLVLMKPFNSIEVVQLAGALTKKWNLARSVRMQIESLAFTVNHRTAELQEANARLQQDIACRGAEAAKDSRWDDEVAALRQKEEFLAIMSHEIVMPMTELSSKIDLLLNTPLNPKQREHVISIQKYAQDLLVLLKDMHELLAGRVPQVRTEDQR